MNNYPLPQGGGFFCLSGSYTKFGSNVILLLAGTNVESYLILCTFVARIVRLTDCLMKIYL